MQKSKNISAWAGKTARTILNLLFLTILVKHGTYVKWPCIVSSFAFFGRPVINNVHLTCKRKCNSSFEKPHHEREKNMRQWNSTSSCVVEGKKRRKFLFWWELHLFKTAPRSPSTLVIGYTKISQIPPQLPSLHPFSQFTQWSFAFSEFLHTCVTF